MPPRQVACVNRQINQQLSIYPPLPTGGAKWPPRASIAPARGGRKRRQIAKEQWLVSGANPPLDPTRGPLSTKKGTTNTRANRQQRKWVHREWVAGIEPSHPPSLPDAQPKIER